MSQSVPADERNGWRSVVLVRTGADRARHGAIRRSQYLFREIALHLSNLGKSQCLGHAASWNHRNLRGPISIREKISPKKPRHLSRIEQEKRNRSGFMRA